MLVTYGTLAALLASAAVAAPLNINLGAYSPALVVGDGEISFAAGAAGAESLVNTLQGAAAAQGGAVAQGQAIAPAAGAPAERAAVLSEPVSCFSQNNQTLVPPGPTKVEMFLNDEKNANIVL